MYVVVFCFFCVEACTLPRVHVFVIYDHRLWRWLHCQRSSDSHKLTHKFYGYLCLNTLQIGSVLFLIGPVWNAYEHLIIIFLCIIRPPPPPPPPPNIRFNTLHRLRSSASRLCFMHLEYVGLTCFQLFICSCNIHTNISHCSTFVTLSFCASAQIRCDTWQYGECQQRQKGRMIS